MLSVLKKMIAINGYQWTFYVLVYVIIRKCKNDCRIPYLDHRIKYLEKKYNLQGMNSLEINYTIWESWNWKKNGGEEWTKSEDWKQSLIDEVMMKYVQNLQTILEIGPGSGKWTETLQTIAKNLTLVDISNQCIEICKQRFSHCNNITYHVTEGSSLIFLPDNSIDFIWSFDVFVHIAPEDIKNYIREFRRVLRQNGIAIIHHADEKGMFGGWRSSMTKELFSDMLKTNNLILINQFDSWGNENQYDVKLYHDIISIFKKE